MAPIISPPQISINIRQNYSYNTRCECPDCIILYNTNPYFDNTEPYFDNNFDIYYQYYDDYCKKIKEMTQNTDSYQQSNLDIIFQEDMSYSYQQSNLNIIFQEEDMSYFN